MDREAAALAWVTVSGMSFGSWNAPATKTPGRDVSSGVKPVGFAETEFVELDAKPGHGLRKRPAWGPGRRPGQRDRSRVPHARMYAFMYRSLISPDPGDLHGPRGNALDVFDIFLAPGPLVILVEILPKGADIHVKDRRLHAVNVLVRDERLLRRRHAADRGAVLIAALANRGNRRTGSRLCAWRPFRRPAAPRGRRRDPPLTACARTGRW